MRQNQNQNNQNRNQNLRQNNNINLFRFNEDEDYNGNLLTLHDKFNFYKYVNRINNDVNNVEDYQINFQNRYINTEIGMVSIKQTLLIADVNNPLNVFIQDSVRKLMINGFDQKSIVNKFINKCLCVRSKGNINNFINCVSYSNTVTRIPRFKTCYPVHMKIYDIFKKYFPKINNYGFNVSEVNENEHFYYHSIRGMMEFVSNLNICRTYSGYFRMTFGENIARSQYMGGVHFLLPQDEYDQERINRYINSSCIPDQNIIRERLTPITYLNNINRLNINQNNLLLCSTDALYYIPNINRFSNAINIHNFNVFNIEEGQYIVDDKLEYLVEYRIKIYVNGFFVDPAPNDHSQPIMFNKLERNIFQNNRKYLIPYVTMYVKGNPQPYEHPFVLIDGFFFSTQLIDSFKNEAIFLNNLYMKININLKINKNLYYINIVFSVSRNRNKLLYEYELNLIESSEINVKIDFIEKEELINYLESREYIKNDSGLKCLALKEEDNFIVLGGNVIQLKKEIKNYKKIGDFINGEYRFEREEVVIKVDARYVNHGINQFRGVDINERIIKSCINALQRLSDTEEDLPKINFFQAHTIANLCAKIAVIYNVKNIINTKLINKEKEKMIRDIDIQEKKEKIKDNIEFGFKIINNVNDGLKDIHDKIDDNQNYFVKKYFGFDKFSKVMKNYNINKNNIDKIRNFILGNSDKNVSSIIGDLINNFINNKKNQCKQYFINILYLICFLIYLYSFMCWYPLFIISSIIFILLNIKLYYVSIKEEFILFIDWVLSFVFVKLFNNFIYNFLFNYVKNIICLFLFVMITTFFDIIFQVMKMYFREDLAYDIYFGFIISSFSLLFLFSFKRLERSIFVKLLFLIGSIIINYYNHKLSYLKHSSFYMSILNFIIFLYNIFQGNGLSYINTILFANKKIYNALGVKSAFVYECGTCTLNNVEEMINFITLMYNYSRNKVKYEDTSDFIKNKYNKRTYGKFKILKLPKNLNCDHTPENENQHLVNYCFQINGFNVRKNYPLKLHKCRRNELESIYRQIQSGVSYDQAIMNQFIKFSKRIIRKMIDEYYMNHPDARIITLEDYYKKLGPRRHEYEEGYEKYCNGGKLEMVYKMHNKDDEKQYLNFNDFKSKSRNICAQLPMGKILLGIPCELGMDILHEQKWCGPGNNYGKRCEKFKEWISNINNCAVISCDGSSFDSTQHQILIKEIDAFFLRRVLMYNSYLTEFYDEYDLLEYINQDQFSIFSKYGFFYRIMGTQLSGRMNTCLCNTLRSGLYIMFILYKMRILNKEELVNFEVNGDDQIIFITLSLVNKYIEYGYKYVYTDKESNIYHGLGQICKIFDVYENITGAEYLSCYFIYDKETNDIWMIRKPERFLQMIPFTFRLNCKNKDKLDYERTKLGKEIVLGALFELKGVKFFEYLLNKFMKLLKEKKCNYIIHRKSATQLSYKINEIKRINNIKKKGGQIFTEKFNVLFEKFLFEKFGINEEDLNDYYKQIDQCNDIDGEITTSIVDKFYPNIRSAEDFQAKCKNLFHNKSYIYVNNPFSRFIRPTDFFVNM